MQVIFAYYGTSCANGYLQHSVQYESTQWAASVCPNNGQNHCQATVNVAVIGDPYPGCRKDFIVVARCGNGQIVADSVPAEAHLGTFGLACY